MELHGPSIESTCSRPPAELLKMRTFPDCTTYSPVQGSPSPKIISPIAYFRSRRCEVRNANSCSDKPEKRGTRFNTASQADSCSVGMPQFYAIAESDPGNCDIQPRSAPIISRGQRVKLDQSKINTAEAITVVQSPRLSPTADWVTFAVRTILFEIR